MWVTALGLGSATDTVLVRRPGLCCVSYKRPLVFDPVWSPLLITLYLIYKVGTLIH